MRRSDRSDFKSSSGGGSSFSRSVNHRESRSDRYHDDNKYRSSANKSFGGSSSDFKKPRRDYDSHSYQDRRDSSRDHHHRFEAERSSFHRNDRRDERPSYRNHSPPPSRLRDRDAGLSRSSFRSSDIRRRLSPPASSLLSSSSSARLRTDYKPPTTGIKSRLAPRIVPSATSRRIALSTSASSSRIIRRPDLRTGIIAKRSTTSLNRAKEYAKKIRQARLKLNEGNSTSSAKAAARSKSETKSPKRGKSTENNEEDFLAIANDVHFDDDDHESTGGKASKSQKTNEEKEQVAAAAGGAGDGESNACDEANEEEKKTKRNSDEPAKAKESKEGRTSRRGKSPSRNRSFSKERVRKFDRIEYVCIHCNKHSTSAQEYRQHLSTRKHLLAMRNVGLRVRATLNRLRKVQRDKQLEIEAMIKDVENIQSKYCQTCKLNFRQSKEEHRESEDHVKIHNFLNPYCKICRLQLISPMKYEVHRCHTDHIRRKLKAQEASEDEIDLENMDIGDFKTVDSVGDDDDEINCEDDDNGSALEVVGIDSVSKIEAHFCSLCHDFICRDDEEGAEELISDHCKSKRHIHRFNEHKKEVEEEEEGKDSNEAIKADSKSIEKTSSARQNGSEMKQEKIDSSEVDRDADVNLDEGSENPEDN